ncbi:MAG: hypothetical protein ABSC01_12150 [Verrucomicrobiota bacterium]
MNQHNSGNYSRDATFPLEFVGQAGLVDCRRSQQVRQEPGIHIMSKLEIAATLRNEVGELEVLIKKLQVRCDRLKTLVLDLEAEITGQDHRSQTPVPDSKFRKMIDKVFGEEPKRPKR